VNSKGATILIHTHQTAPRQFVEARGIGFAYRRFGKPDNTPLLFNQPRGMEDSLRSTAPLNQCGDVEHRDCGTD
jgi:hypothetical protein